MIPPIVQKSGKFLCVFFTYLAAHLTPWYYRDIHSGGRGGVGGYPYCLDCSLKIASFFFKMPTTQRWIITICYKAIIHHPLAAYGLLIIVAVDGVPREWVYLPVAYVTIGYNIRVPMLMALLIIKMGWGRGMKMHLLPTALQSHE